MNRKKFSGLLGTYLWCLFAIFLLEGALFVFLGHSHYFLIGTIALFVCLSIPIALWIRGLERSVNGLTRVVNNLGEGNWDAPLPSTSVGEIWSLISSVHSVRNAIRERVLELQGDKEKLTRMLSNLKEGILVTDPSNRVEMANDTVGEILNLKPSEMIGKSLDSFMDGDLKPLFAPLIRGEEISKVVTLSLPERIYFYQSYVSKNPEGNLVAKGMVLRDVTESQRVEELRKAFVANASHELRSPVAGLQAILDALEMGGLEDADQRKKFIGMMSREVGRLNAIIQDLLDLSEMERERPFSREPFHVAALFTEWLDVYLPQIAEKNLSVTTRFQEEEIVMDGSAPDIERLFRNLFENALKYTPPGGSIEIGLRREEGDLHGWVKDSGVGIPEQHIPRIFERFYRADTSRSRALGGTGLGLSIARHAVERHGGKIWVESRENEGSAFHFLLPLTGVCPVP